MAPLLGILFLMQAAGGCEAVALPRSGLGAGVRAAVVQHEERIAEAVPRLRGLSANTLVTHAAPDAATGRAAAEAGLRYIAWMTTSEIAALVDQPAAAARLASMPGLTGVYYEDDAVVEGYTTPDEQRRAYATLKLIRPSLLVLHPLRLDPIAWDPTYLDRVFRPEFTDAVVPYFYPVGSTVLGAFDEAGDWRSTLRVLLSEVAPRSGRKPVLPVLQAFEQPGYPVGSDLLAAQLDVYREAWPDASSAAVFEWGESPDEDPLVGFAFRPRLEAGVRALFRSMEDESLARRPCSPREVPRRLVP